MAETKTVSIAVAINNLGEWVAGGYHFAEDRREDDRDRAAECAWDGLSERPGDRAHLVWITAEIPVPKVEEVQGRVTGFEIGEE